MQKKKKENSSKVFIIALIIFKLAASWDFWDHYLLRTDNLVKVDETENYSLIS